MADPAESLTANEYIIEKGVETQMVIYWYHQGTRSVAGDLMAQIYALPELVLHGRTDTALIRIIVPLRHGDMDSARRAATDFARNSYPLIKKHIIN